MRVPKPPFDSISEEADLDVIRPKEARVGYLAGCATFRFMNQIHG